MELLALCLDVGEGRQAACPRNVVRCSSDSSAELGDDYWLGTSPKGAPGDASDEHTPRCPPGDRDSDATDDEEFYQSPIHWMEVAGEELDNQQALCNVEAHVPEPEIDDSAERVVHELAARVRATSNPIMSMEHAGVHVKDKRKEKVDERMKELVYIGGVSLVDLDIEVTDKDLMMDSSESDDNVSPNPDSVGVRDGPRSSSHLWMQMLNLHPFWWLRK